MQQSEFNNFNAYKETQEYLEEAIELTNTFWTGLIKLVLTISSTILFGSFAIINIPIYQEQIRSSFAFFLPLSWILLMVSIFSFIMGLLEQAKFYAVLSNRYANSLQKIWENIGNNVDSAPFHTTYPILYMPLIYPILAFLSFFIGVICLISFLSLNIFRGYENYLLILALLLTIFTVLSLFYIVADFYSSQEKEHKSKYIDNSCRLFAFLKSNIKN